MNALRHLLGLAVCLSVTTALPAIPPEEFQPLINAIHQAQDGRDLNAAEDLVKEALDQQGAALTPHQKDLLDREQERLRRIRKDYSLTRERLAEVCQSGISDFRPGEVDEWEGKGWLDWKIVDGEKRYVGASRSNLFYRYPEIAGRRIEPRGTRWEQFLASHVEEVMSEFTVPGQFLGKPREKIVTMTITARDGAAQPAEVIRCWMPFPQVTESQTAVDLLDASPDPMFVNAPGYPARSIYFEQAASEAGGAVFQAKWAMTARPRWARIDPAVVQPLDPERHAAVLAYTREQPPHVVFTPEIQQLARELTEGIENPALRARRIYDWISENIQYSFAREYCTLRNISMYTLENSYGDCGQIALLYIALCRAAGIPARWQSGWITVPGMHNMHDWSEIYLEPYGWVPVDPNYAVFARQSMASLSDEQRAMMLEFFFGGMDAYRMCVNRDHGYPHYPPKSDWRSDDVDFQRGELETRGRTLYFDQFRYVLNIEHAGEGGE